MNPHWSLVASFVTRCCGGSATALTCAGCRAFPCPLLPMGLGGAGAAPADPDQRAGPARVAA